MFERASRLPSSLARLACAGVLLAGVCTSPADAASPAEMLQRAQAHDAWMRARLMPAGGVMSAQFTDERYTEVQLYAGRRDPAIWTGAYLAALALRLLTTADPEAAQQMEQTLQVLHRWWNISGDPGYLARFAAPANSPAAILASLPADDPEVVRDVAFDGGIWHWRGRVSRDQYQGIMLGMSLAYEATTDPALRQMIRDDVLAFAEQLMRRETRRVRIRINGGLEVPMSLTLQHAVYTDDETEDGIPILDISTDPLGAEIRAFASLSPARSGVAGDGKARRRNELVMIEVLDIEREDAI